MKRPTDVINASKDITIAGLVLNKVDANALHWLVEDLDGWWDLPESEVPDTPKAFVVDGSYYRAGRFAARDITLKGALVPVGYSANTNALINARNTINRAINIKNGPLILQVDEPDASKRSIVQLRARPDISINSHNNILRFNIPLRAGDPRKYATLLSTASTGIFTAAGVRVYPRTYTWVYTGGTGGTGPIDVNNIGTATTEGVLTITGPVTNPTIEQLGTGRFLKFNITLSSTDVLRIDLNKRTVILNGTANRLNTLVPGSDWFRFSPGVSTLRYLASSGTVASVATLEYRSAWT